MSYVEGRFQREPVVYAADEDAEYEQVITIDLSALRPTVAFPHLPENTKTIDQCDGQVKIDQAVIGSCTNGRMEDMRAAASILKGRKVAKGVRCIVIPATQQIWTQCMHEGLFDIFVEAGAVVGAPPDDSPGWGIAVVAGGVTVGEKATVTPSAMVREDVKGGERV